MGMGLKQLGKMMEHPNQSQPNPGLRADGTPQCSNEIGFSVSDEYEYSAIQIVLTFGQKRIFPNIRFLAECSVIWPNIRYLAEYLGILEGFRTYKFQILTYFLQNQTLLANIGPNIRKNT